MASLRRCPYCGAQMTANVYDTHLAACARRPNDEWLIDTWNDGQSLGEIADQIGVTKHYIRTWLRDAGVDTSSRARGDSTPYFGRRGRCDENCNGWDQCRRMQLLGLWCLCSKPLDELEIRRFWVSFGSGLARISNGSPMAAAPKEA